MKPVKTLCFLALSLALFLSFTQFPASERLHTYSKVDGNVSVHVYSRGQCHGIPFCKVTYVLRVTHEDPSRGLFLDIALFNGEDDIADYIAKCVVIASAEGLSFVQPNGVTMFVPKSLYGPQH
ncbi:MAG: hypothetical protein ACJ8GW_07480 [Massilia sp.]